MSKFSLSDILWSTRGQEWGFRFLHTPSTHNLPWERVYEKIFAENGNVPKYWHGTLQISGAAPVFYIACRIYDSNEQWKDSANRVIPQEFIAILSDKLPKGGYSVAWANALMDTLRPYYRDVYNGNPEDIPKEAYTGDIQLFDRTENEQESIEYNIILEKRIDKFTHASPKTRFTKILTQEIHLKLLLLVVMDFLRRITQSPNNRNIDEGESK